VALGEHPHGFLTAGLIEPGGQLPASTAAFTRWMAFW
jgi:hypothetical protein